ncbi:MAG TPA: hypothetical protein VHY37_03655, partial [Tepidisphaeraceae bacterium]|nr:hypothetical protein [Tepidisphaeraceae bacterium]
LITTINTDRERPIHAHTFYDLRRTFISLANEAADPSAVLRIAGRKLSDVDDTYLQMLLLVRMVKVVDHVRGRSGVVPVASVTCRAFITSQATSAPPRASG